MSIKTVSSQSILGQLGANQIERIVLNMGYVWRPTVIFDVGVDGEIEICDPVTGEATNSIVKVQAKATRRSFQAETQTFFEYHCGRRDIDYWLRGNAPTILIICRPHDNEAYWVNIKQYFADLSTQKSLKVKFEKQRDQFDENSASALKALALHRDAGIYFSPLLRTEKLYANLLPIAHYAPQIFVAETDFRKPADVWSYFDSIGVRVGPEWFLKDKRLISFHNLEESPFTSICDLGTLDVFDTSEWADSEDEDMRRDFVYLLNSCLKEKAWQLGLKYHREGSQNQYYFRPDHGLRPVRISYQSLQNRVSREVFKQYKKKSKPELGAYCRHSAFEGFFVRYEGQWFLEITPTYHFTFDGRHPDFYAATRLAGIKRLERNPAVLGQLLMWADLLSASRETLYTQEYRFLNFGNIMTVDIDAGIPDAIWYQSDDLTVRDAEDSPQNQLSLLGL